MHSLLVRWSPSKLPSSPDNNDNARQVAIDHCSMIYFIKSIAQFVLGAMAVAQLGSNLQGGH